MADKYNLVGIDGNAFAVMGYVRRALRNEGLNDEIGEYTKAAMVSDYNNLLMQSLKYISMANKAAEETDEYVR